MKLESEGKRLELLVRRDGLQAAREWVERTLKLYQEAIASASSHASSREYRPLFETSIRDFEQWLRDGGTTARTGAP